MLRNHIKIAWRILRKNRLYSALNILGLTLGVSGFLMISLFIQDELSYDHFFEDSEQVYRITTHWGETSTASYATAPPPLGPRIQADIPEVEAVTRLLKWNDFTVQPAEGINQDEIFREDQVFYAEPGFFEVFDFPVAAGSKEKALSGPEYIVLTTAAAQKYFGDISPQEVIGKQLLIGSNNPIAREVALVIETIPEQSHFDFDMLVYEPGMHQEIFLRDLWSWSILYTYVKFPQGKREVVQSKLDQLVAKYALPALDEGSQKSDYRLNLMPVQDIHLQSHLLRELKPNSYQNYIYLFGWVGIFILFLAAVNFINLATAKAGLRTMEVGVRKVLGSGNSQLIWQFLTEAFILVFVSVLFSLVLVQLSNGLFNQLTGKNLDFNLFQNPFILAVTPALIVVLTLLSGFYPAFYLSSFRPILVLKKQLSIGKNSHGFRNGLVVFQFATTLTLIICTLVVHRQLAFIQQSDPGFLRDQLLIIHNDGEIQNSQREDFIGRVSSSSRVESMSFSTGIPMANQFQMRSFNLPTESVQQGMNWYEADANYLETYQFKLSQGRNFSSVAGADIQKVIINQKAAETLGITEKPLGQLIIKNQGAEDQASLEVIGVVEDFNFESFRNEIKPLVIEYLQDYYLRDYISVRLQAGDMKSAVEELETVWKSYEPRVPMNYSFLDEDFGKMYESEMRMEGLLSTLTMISIVIAILGLFGLTSFTAHLRTKEIGIRKVFGASMVEIFLLLSKSYLQLILIAILVAVPIAVFAMNKWLEEFAYQTSIGVWVILFAVGSCLGLAMGTIFIQSYKNLRADPVKSLKTD
ncbi:ABC transporter permease [Algoriphagus lacus]|uniref:ABC transporter permease n=1 Tax=Algoriphagus lacus TaxID=2056311 RepID=A0A418PML0_9BACT|nr:ABC transporter permease [Algoriphagus lacus]RIW12949.1 ABC transporter permease [Algoriphagus lacus]